MAGSTRSTPRARAKAEAEKQATLMVDGVELVIDANEFELGEMEEIEAYTGADITNLDLASPRTLVILIYVLRRRTDPNYTLDDARKIKMGRLGEEDDEGKGSGSSNGTSG
jgi:hypothetical protein